LIILGIETATQICSVALINERSVLGEYYLNIRNAHERVITSAIDRLLQDARIRVQEVDAIAVSIGPGSFTGLRIGLSLAKGLALPDDIPLTGVNTLYALAHQAPVKEGMICPVIHSRATEFYFAMYERQNGKDILRQDVQVKELEELAAFLPNDASLIGQPYSKVKELADKKGCEVLPEKFHRPSAVAIAEIGYEQILQNKKDNLLTLEPYYYNDFIAGKPRKPVIAS